MRLQCPGVPLCITQYPARWRDWTEQCSSSRSNALCNMHQLVYVVCTNSQVREDKCSPHVAFQISTAPNLHTHAGPAFFSTATWHYQSKHHQTELTAIANIHYSNKSSDAPPPFRKRMLDLFGPGFMPAMAISRGCSKAASNIVSIVWCFHARSERMISLFLLRGSMLIPLFLVVFFENNFSLQFYRLLRIQCIWACPVDKVVYPA